MSPLLLFLLLACLLSVLSASSQSGALWPRLVLLPLLTLIYGSNVLGLASSSTLVLLAVGGGFAACLLRWGHCSVAHLVRMLGPLSLAFFLVFWVGFRPALLEYPADHVAYWQRLIEASGISSADAQSCEMGDLATYVSSCTLWVKLAAAGALPQSWLVTGLYAKAVHCGELLLLALTLIRFWLVEKVRPLASACMLVLVFLGTGYLYDAFVINHAMQGSLLAAALLVESASAYCWLFARLRRIGVRSRLVLFVASWYGLGFVYLVLMSKLHGLFALLLLIWVLIVPVAVACLPSRCFMSAKPIIPLFGLSSLALTVGLFSVKDAFVLSIPSNFAGVVIRWSDAMKIAGFGDWGPASFLPRTSDTRPEALAVLSLLAAVLVLCSSSGPRLRDPDAAFSFSKLASADPYPWSTDVALLTSLYVVALLVAYILPPFSNLFLKLNPDYSAHMRLMWGACLVSPLPCLLFFPSTCFRRLIVALSCLAMTVVLIPVQFRSGQRSQVFFSKARQFVLPTPEWADPAHVARLLMPRLVAIAGSEKGLRGMRVAADPLVRTALYPFALVGDPPIDSFQERFYSFEQISRSSRDPEIVVDPNPAAPLSSLVLPDVIIQQKLRDCFYSVYADMQAYDPCVAAGVTRVGVNRLPAERLSRLGYVLVWQSAADGYKIWRRFSD